VPKEAYHPFLVKKTLKIVQCIYAKKENGYRQKNEYNFYQRNISKKCVFDQEYKSGKGDKNYYKYNIREVVGIFTSHGIVNR
jgi:hypothetical protein